MTLKGASATLEALGSSPAHVEVPRDGAPARPSSLAQPASPLCAGALGEHQPDVTQSFKGSASAIGEPLGGVAAPLEPAAHGARHPAGDGAPPRPSSSAQRESPLCASERGERQPDMGPPLKGGAGALDDPFGGGAAPLQPAAHGAQDVATDGAPPGSSSSAQWESPIRAREFDERQLTLAHPSRAPPAHSVTTSAG